MEPLVYTFARRTAVKGIEGGRKYDTVKAETSKLSEFGKIRHYFSDFEAKTIILLKKS